MQFYNFRHFVILFVLILNGCSVFGGDEEDGQMTISGPPMEKIDASEPPEPIAEELLAAKDEALVHQGLQLSEMQNEIMSLRAQNEDLAEELKMSREELQASQEELAMKQQMLDEQITNAAVNASASGPIEREVAPDGGYGLHLASFLRRENIAPGLNTIERLIPVLQGKPVKISTTSVGGREYMRLVIGQYNERGDAVAECSQAKLLVDYCEVVAFEGEDF